MNHLHATGLCPVCRCTIAGFDRAAAGPGPEEAARQCARCQTWYHGDCWDYGGGCAIFGCAPVRPSRPCATPRAGEPVTLGQHVTRTGTRLAAGALLWIIGGAMGLAGWKLLGPLVLPALVVVNWLVDPRAPGGGRDRAVSIVRWGALFGPVMFMTLPFPGLYLLMIPAGLAVAALGLAITALSAMPRTAAGAVFGAIAVLSWSHAPDQVPLPFTVQGPVPRWALPHHRWSHRPYLMSPAQLLGAWEPGRVPDDARVVVFPRGAPELSVTRVAGRVRVTAGHVSFEVWPGYRPAAPRLEPVAVVLPGGTESVEVVERDLCRAVAGARLDDLLRAPGLTPREGPDADR